MLESILCSLACHSLRVVSTHDIQYANELCRLLGAGSVLTRKALIDDAHKPLRNVSSQDHEIHLRRRDKSR